MQKQLIKILQNQFQQTQIDDKVDQVVSMIFRSNSIYQIQLLFLQRKYCQTDHYSGDICLPGGYRQKDERCIDTAIRETKQQTNINLTKANYIGALNYTFFSRKGKSKVRGNKQTIDLRMGILMFQIDYNEGNYIKLQQNQIRAYKWIPLNIFLQGNIQRLKTWDIMYEVAPKKARILRFPAYQIQMQRVLYGLTLYTVTLFVATIYELSQKYVNAGIIIDFQFYKLFTTHITNLQIQGDQQQLKIAKKQYLQNRVGFLKPKL